MTANMRILLTLAATTLSLAPTLTGQAGATSLTRLVQRADVIVQARTNGVPSGNAAVHVFRFQAERSLKGLTDPTFQLSEPAGRCCGRALAGLAPGSYVLFLNRDGGEYHLSVSGSRSVVAADPTLTQHIVQLLSAADPRGRISIVAAALKSTNRRVREDAALSLPFLPELETANQTDQARIAEAISQDLKGAGTQVGLLVAAERLALTSALDDVLPTYLENLHPRLAPLLLRAIPRIDGVDAARRITAIMPADPRGRLRAATLLRDLPALEARTPLLELLTTATDSAAAHAGEALIHQGADPAWIESQTVPFVMDSIRKLRIRASSDTRGPIR